MSKGFGLRSQIRRTSISISSNIAEGYGRKSSKEFVYFLNVIQASCYEVKSQLHLALDILYISESEFNSVFSICGEISKTIHGLIKHLKKTNSKTDLLNPISYFL